MTITYVVWGITAGMCIAVIYLYFIKKICGGFVKTLTDNGCVGAENAKNPQELGIKAPSGYLKKQLAENGGMSNIIKTADGGKYYIPEDKILLAGKKYRSESLPLVAVLGLALLIAAVGGIAGYLAPTILDAAGELF